MEVIPVAPDGDCLFHSLALNEDGGDGASLRGEVIAFLEQHAARQADATETAAWLEEAEHLKGPKESNWGGHTAIVAYCAMRNKSAVLHTRYPNNPQVTEQAVTHATCTGEGTVPTIHLLYNGQDHYQGLLHRSSITSLHAPAWEEQSPLKYFIRGTDHFPSLRAAAAEHCNNKKRPGLQAPRFRPRAKPKLESKGNKTSNARKRKTVTATDGQPAAPATFSAEQPHYRYRCKTTPPPELQDDVLTIVSNARVASARSKHPHRNLEEMIKASSA